VTRKAAPIGAAIALFLVPAGALGAKPPRLTLPLPGAGHVTVAAVSVKVKADRPPGLVRHVRFRAPHAKRLPQSVRVLTATRFRRAKHGGTYSGLVVAINRAAAQTSDSKEPQTFIDLLLGDTPRSRCPGCGFFVPDDDFAGRLCSVCRHTQAFGKAAAAQDADEASAVEPLLLQMLKVDWSATGGGASLDTGHYDDGHAFGWDVKTKKQIADIEHEVIEDILKGDQGNLIPDLEGASGTDLNGNGQIDQPLPGGGQQVTTVVGPPTIL